MVGLHFATILLQGAFWDFCNIFGVKTHSKIGYQQRALFSWYVYILYTIYLYIYLWYSSDVFKFNKNGLKQPFEDCRRMKDSFIKKRTNKRRWDRSALGTKRFSSVLHLRLRSFSFLLYTVFCLLFLKRDKQGKNWRISDISLLFSQIFLKYILRRNWSCTEKLCCISMMPN